MALRVRGGVVVGEQQLARLMYELVEFEPGAESRLMPLRHDIDEDVQDGIQRNVERKAIGLPPHAKKKVTRFFVARHLATQLGHIRHD